MSQQPPAGPPPGQPPGQPMPPAPGGGAPMGAAGQPTDAQGRVLAHWWKRVVAALIDGVILSIPSWILMAILGAGFASSAECTQDLTTGVVECTGGGGFLAGMLISALIIFALGIAYTVYFNGSERGQTVGKMVMKIQVRDEATGGPIGYGKAALRWIVTLVLGILCYIPAIVDALFPLWDPKRQTIHDKAAGSVVIDLAP